MSLSCTVNDPFFVVLFIGIHGSCYLLLSKRFLFWSPCMHVTFRHCHFPKGLIAHSYFQKLLSAAFFGLWKPIKYKPTILHSLGWLVLRGYCSDLALSNQISWMESSNYWVTCRGVKLKNWIASKDSSLINAASVKLKSKSSSKFFEPYWGESKFPEVFNGVMKEWFVFSSCRKWVSTKWWVGLQKEPKNWSFRTFGEFCWLISFITSYDFRAILWWWLKYCSLYWLFNQENILQYNFCCYLFRLYAFLGWHFFILSSFFFEVSERPHPLLELQN